MFTFEKRKAVSLSFFLFLESDLRDQLVIDVDLVC